MATVYLVTNTENTKTVNVQPKTVNGPAGVLSDTDINLHGSGAVKWGSMMDENFLRLTENFACSESAINPGKPKNSIELQSNGHGINNPIVGQSWYNTSRKSLMVFDGTNWAAANGAPTTKPTTPVIGTLWFDKNHYTTNTATNAGLGQMMIFDSNGWQRLDQQLNNVTASHYMRRSGTSMTGTLILSGEPTAANHAATKQYVDATVAGAVMAGLGGLQYMPMSGGTMVDSTIPNEPWNHIQFNGGQSIIASKSHASGTMRHELSMWTGVKRSNGDKYINGRGASKFVLFSGDYQGITQGGAIIQTAKNTNGTADGVVHWSSYYFHYDRLQIEHKKIVNLGDATDPQDAMNRRASDARYAKVFTTTPPYSEANPGSIWVDNGKIWIAITQGNWKQVF